MSATWVLRQEPHRHYAYNGSWQIGKTRIASVTQILGEGSNGLSQWAQGQAYLAAEAEGLASGLAERAYLGGYGPDAIRDAGARRGNAVHLAAGCLSRGEKPAPATAETWPYLQGLAEFWKNQEPAECTSELAVGSRKHVYAGTLDLTAKLKYYRGLSLVDFKTSRTGSTGWTHPLQAAAYEAARREGGLHPAVNLLICYLTPYGTYFMVDVREVGGYATCRRDFLRQLALFRRQKKIEQALRGIDGLSS